MSLKLNVMPKMFNGAKRKAETSSEDSSSSEEEKIKNTLKCVVKNQSKPAGTAIKAKKKESSSDSDSSSEEEQKPTPAKVVAKAPAKPAATPAKVAKKESSSDSDSSSEEEQKPTPAKVVAKAPAKPAATPAKVAKKDSSSDSDSSSEEEKKPIPAKVVAKAPSKPINDSSSDSDSFHSASEKVVNGFNHLESASESSDSQSDKFMNALKRKTILENETSLPHKIQKTGLNFSSNISSKKNNQPKESFRRVKDEDADPNLLLKIGKNAFDYKKGAEGSWGEKASKDLIHTRGKSFRHEKTKKKRGSYRGGKIDTNTYSIKFDESD